MLIDSHCHLSYDGIYERLSDVILNAKNNDVNLMLNICTDFSDIEKLVKISNDYENIYHTVGIHPNNVSSISNFDSLLPDFIEHFKDKNTKGVGETGLDYYREDKYKKEQQKSFDIHFEIAKKQDAPIIIHSRSAEDDTIAFIKNHDHPKGILHCFTGSYDMAKKCIDLGFLISFSGIVTFNNATDLKDVVKKLPLDRMLIETDSPFLAPQPYRGKTNEPAYVKYVAEQISILKNVPYETVAQQTTDNFLKLFDKITI